MHLSKLALYAPLALASTIRQYGDGDDQVRDGQPSFPRQGDFHCDLPPPLDPSGDGLAPGRDLFTSQDALLRQVERHSALVRVPSVCYDDLGPFDEDPRWRPFRDLHDVLARTFPLVHASFAREAINTFGLLYTLTGADPSLKPLMLTAHQDVVPVADPATWTHPPFDAVFDGTWLWGRGASDDKNSMTALLSALEALLAQPAFRPRRTVLLAFGFDEECSGLKGAGAIAVRLRATYGNDSLAVVLDEGGMGLQEVGGGEDDEAVLYALPAVTEKGHVDVWFTLHVQGGHSSTPFPHTGIGIVSEMVVALESHPYEPVLLKGSPIYQHYVCQARYSPRAQPRVTELLRKGDLQKLATELAAQDRPTNFRLQTSQAVDYVGGGQKINAMPEVVTLGVNYRVAPQDSIGAIMRNIVRYTKPIAEKYRLKVRAFEEDDEYASHADGEGHDDDEEEEEEEGFRPTTTEGWFGPLYDVDYNATLVLTATQKTQAAPISPSDDEVWDIFSGTIQHAFAFDGGKVVPVGELMTGNTDTRHYLDLTRNVYRWTPVRQGGSDGVHTIDERVNMTVHLELVRFYYDFVRNFDAADVARVDTAEAPGEPEL